jgi:hypothetical protein
MNESNVLLSACRLWERTSGKTGARYVAVVSRRWWKLGGAGTETAWWSGSGREVKVGG